MHGFALLLLHIAAVEAEVVAYLGDPQIGFSGNETEDTIRFGMAADAVKAAKAGCKMRSGRAPRKEEPLRCRRP